MDKDLLKFEVAVTLLVIITAALFLAIYLRDKAKKKREKQSQMQYREKYVSEVGMADARFGMLTGEYDCGKHTLFADNLELPPFGKSQPFLITADDYTPDRNMSILRTLEIAYDWVPEILRGLAEAVRKVMMFDTPAADLPPVEEIIELITVTDFQFVFDAEIPVMQVIGGAEYERAHSVISFGLNAMYKINEKSWEYDAERIGA